MKQIVMLILVIGTFFAGKLVKEVSSNQLISEQFTNQQFQSHDDSNLLDEELDYHLIEANLSMGFLQQQQQNKRELQYANRRILAGRNMTINLNQFSLLANPLSDQELQAINTPVFYIGAKGYTVYTAGKSVKTPDITTTLNQTLLCPKGNDKNCYLLLMVNTSLPGQPKSKVKCLTTNLCFLTAVQNSSNQIIGILGNPFLVQQIPIKQAWTSNNTVFWSKSDAYQMIAQIPDASYAATVEDLVEPRLCVNSAQCFYQLGLQQNTSLNPDDNIIQLGLLNFTCQNDQREFEILNLGGQNVYVETLKLRDAWYSEDFVIWRGLYPYKLIDVLKETSFYTLKPDLSELGTCIGYTNCFDNIVKVDVIDPFAKNDSVTCLGSTCFTAQPTLKSEEIVLIDDLAFLVYKEKFQDAWTTNETVFWNGGDPYRIIIAILNEEFSTVVKDPIGQRLCQGNGWTNCLINLKRLNSKEVTAESLCLAPQQTGCYIGDTDSNVYEIMALENAAFISVQINFSTAWYLNQIVVYKSQIDSWQILYPLLNNEFFNSQLDITDPTLRVCTGGYSTNCFTELSIIEQESELNVAENSELPSENDEEQPQEETEPESGFCIGKQCFQGTLDPNQYDIISINSETVLVIKSSQADSWNSSQPVVWLDKINPYIPFLLLENNTFSTIEANLDNMRVCYNQEECYVDIIQVEVEDPSAENDTVKCYNDICYSGSPYQNQWQIALIDGDAFLVEQLSFGKAWVSQQQIIWNNFTDAYQVYELLENKTFWTVSLEISEILLCSNGMDNCITKLVFVDSNTPEDQLTDQKCFGGFCYIGEFYYTNDGKIICLNERNDKYCYFAIQLDNSTAKDSLKLEIFWMNEIAYVPLHSVEDNIPGQISLNIKSLIVCIPDDGCYTNLQKTMLTESTETIKVICKEEFGTCWKGTLYDLEKDSDRDADDEEAETQVGKEFIISFRSTNLIGSFKQLAFQDGWFSENTIFWVNAIPYEYQNWLESSEIIDQNIKLNRFRMCLFKDKCYEKLQLLDESSEQNNTELCIADTCFDGELDESQRDVVLLGNITILVRILDYETAYTSRETIIWQFKNAYDVLFLIEDNEFYTITLALNSVFGCFGGGVENCYNNFVPAASGQSVNGYQSINCYNQIDQCYQMDSFFFPYKTPEYYASIYKGQPRQVQLCFESYCLDAQETSFIDAWNKETYEAYIWIGQQPYIPLQQSNDDSLNEATIYGELKDTVVCPEGKKQARSRFDKECGKPIYFYGTSEVEGLEDKIKCVREGSDICYSYIPYIVTEKVIFFTDQRIKVLVQDMNYVEAWYLNETVIWQNGLDPYKLIDTVNIDTQQNLIFKLLDMQICYNSADCWINFQNFNDEYTYAIEKPYKCLMDYCYVAQFDDTSYAIALINNKAIFLQKLSFENAWYSEAEIIWYEETGYKILKSADSKGFYDLIIDYKQLVYCLKGGKICVNKLRVVDPRQPQKKKIQTIKLGPDFYYSDVYSKLNIKPPEKREDVICYEKIQEIKQKIAERKEQDRLELESEPSNDQLLKLKTGRNVVKKVKTTNKIVVKKNSTHGLKVQKNLKKNGKRSLQSQSDNSLNQFNNSETPMVPSKLGPFAIKMRNDFRDYFLYAIGNSINNCSSSCPKSQCCAQVIGQNREIRDEDYLCMNSQIVNSQSSITINDNQYLMKCMSPVSAQAEYFKYSYIGIIITLSILLFS